MLARGVRFSLGRSQQRTEEDVLVNTIIERPNQPAFALDWRVAEVGGQPKVVDVIAEGTSLRLTQRSDYAAFLKALRAPAPPASASSGSARNSAGSSAMLCALT